MSAHDVAVITGAASGIGRALALELAVRGARLALADIDAAGLAETAALARQRGAEVHTERLDVSDAAAFNRYAHTVVAHYGVVHQLYNNAGIGGAATPFVDTDPAAFDRVLAINVGGVVHGTRAFLPHLIASGRGHLINISSLNGFLAQSEMAAYCASKFAVRGFTESIRADMLRGRHPVRVTVVHPGGVKTNIATSTLAHAGSLTPAQAAAAERRTRVYNDVLFKTSATAAATTILDGVARGAPRILVGRDARLVDLLVRFLPTHYPRLLTWWERRMFGEPTPSGRAHPATDSATDDDHGKVRESAHTLRA